MNEYLQKLKESITGLHGCECSHVGTSRVIEYYDGGKVFDGNVETFSLHGHSDADRAYAWACHSGGAPCYMAVLKKLPIWDPSDAVREVLRSREFC